MVQTATHQVVIRLLCVIRLKKRRWGGGARLNHAEIILKAHQVTTDVCLSLPWKFLSDRLISGDTVIDMKLHNGKEVFCTVKNGEKQGDNNSVDYFSRQLYVMCEVKVRNTDVFLCACMYISTILTNIRQWGVIG